MKFKKLISIGLALTMTTACLPVVASADTAPSYETSAIAKSDTDIAYPVEGGNIYFDPTTGTITDADETVTKADIPDQINGTPVTSIGQSAFRFCTELTKVTVPASVKTIDYSAFGSCEKLEEVIISNGVTDIITWAFAGCIRLTEITIPDSVVNIGSSVFAGCDNLQKIEVGGGNSAYSSMDGVLYSKDKSCLVKVPNGLADYKIPDSVTSIGDTAFARCKKLKEIIIPNGVVSIGGGAFGSCEIREITIPDSVTSIGNNAFMDCQYLRKIEVSEGNTIYSSIDGVLYNKDKSCLVAVPNSLYNYVIPDSVTSIADTAFAGCQNLYKITIPDRITSIGVGAFSSCTSIQEVTVPYGITEIMMDTFNNCSQLRKVTIPDSVTNIGSNAFDSCINLSEINIPDKVTNIGYGAFESCSGLTEITIPESVTNIDDWAFAFCNKLTEVTINGAASIGEKIFNDCTALKTVYCHKGTPADDYSLYPEGVTIVYLDGEPTIPDIPNKPVVPEGLGDVDGDGAVTSNDAAKAYVLAAAKDYDAKADVDGNKAVEAKDAEEIMKKVMRASHKFPLEISAA